MDNIKVTGFSSRSKFQTLAEPIIRAPIKRRHVSIRPIVTSHKVKAEFVTDAPKEQELRDGWLFIGSVLCLVAGAALAVAYAVMKAG